MIRDRFRTLFIITILPLGLLCTLPQIINAQNRIDTWTTDNNLPQNSVTGLTQTPDGYIWFTTNDGLVRFDGFQFKVFNKSNTPEISSNRMNNSFADRSGRLWMQTDDGEILVYEKGAFNVAMKPGELHAEFRSVFFDDPNGGVVFRDKNRHYRFQNGRFVPLTIEGLSEDSELALADRERGLWFIDGRGLLQRSEDGNITTYDLSRFNPGTMYRTGYEDRAGGVWLGSYYTPNQCLLRIKNGRVHSFQLPAAPVSHFAEDLAGNLWVSVYKKGIYRIDHKTVAADEPPADALELVSPLDGLSNVTSGCLCPDREGGMWVSTNKGLVRILPQIIHVYSKEQGVSEENVYPIYQDSAGNIWAGAWDSTLLEYENGTFKAFPRTKETNYVTSLFEDRSGRFWIGSIDTLRYRDRGRWVKFTEQAGFFGDLEFSVITQDRDNNLWFGTSQGLSRYSGGSSTVFTKEDGLPDDYVVTLLQTNDGTMWVGTRGGLSSISNGKVEAFKVEDGLAGNYIRSLYEDSDRVLWIGSYDGGLTRLKDGKFTRFTVKDGLSSNGIFCILEDAFGWFWMNCNQGIFRISKQELNDFADGKIRFLASISYNKQDGLLNVEGNGGRQPAGIKARDGKLWFPTAQGIAVVDPNAVTIDQLPPPVLIEGVVIDSKPLDNDDLQSAMSKQSDIALRPSQSNLEIKYTGISFINSAQVKFKYKLEGLEHDWIEVGTRRTAYYSYLPPGDYTFRVIAANRDGIWNNEGASVRVKVFPPFYRTTWFVLLCVAVVACLVWAAYRYRVHQLHLRLQLQFEERLSERTRIAQDLHDTLLQGFLSVFMQLDVANDNVPADLPAKQQLNRLQQLMGRVIEEGRNAVQGLRSKNDDSTNLEQAFSRIQQELGVSEQIGFRVIVEGRPRAMNPVIRDEVYRTGREALVNAFRHSKARSIEVEVEYSTRSLRILVRDDGCGIDPAILRAGREGHWGLSGMRERAERIGAELKVSSRASVGTEVELSVPGHVAFQAPSNRHPLGWFARLYQKAVSAQGRR